MKTTLFCRFWPTAVFVAASIVFLSCDYVDSHREDDNHATPAYESSSAGVKEKNEQIGVTSQSLEFSTLGGGLGFVDPIHKIIRSEGEWAALYKIHRLGDQAYIGDFPPPFPYDVDFSKHMVVIVSLGKQDKAGPFTANVSIESISIVDSVLEVRYVQRVPPKDSATLGDHVYPAHIVKTSKVGLTGKFIMRTEIIKRQ